MKKRVYKLFVLIILIFLSTLYFSCSKEQFFSKYKINLYSNNSNNNVVSYNLRYLSDKYLLNVYGSKTEGNIFYLFERGMGNENIQLTFEFILKNKSADKIFFRIDRCFVVFFNKEDVILTTKPITFEFFKYYINIKKTNYPWNDITFDKIMKILKKYVPYGKKTYVFSQNTEKTFYLSFVIQPKELFKFDNIDKAKMYIFLNTDTGKQIKIQADLNLEKLNKLIEKVNKSSKNEVEEVK